MRQRSIGHSSSSKPRGFTLVELLVVITIIGMLMALAFPGIGAVLEAARSMQCRAALKSIGTAIATFESSRGRLPPGQPSCVEPDKQWITGGSSAGAICQGPNWAVMLLGNLDEPSMATNVKKCLTSTDPDHFCANTCEDIATEEFGEVGLSTPPIFTCPSADVLDGGLSGGDMTWGLEGLTKGNYAANFGKATFEEAILRPSDTSQVQDAKARARGTFSVTYVEKRSRIGSRGKMRRTDVMGAWKTGEKSGLPSAAIKGSKTRTMLVSEVKAFDSPFDGRGVWTNTSMGASIFTAKTPPNAIGDKQNNPDWFDHIQICDEENISDEHPSNMHCVTVRDKRNQVWAAARSDHTNQVNVLYCDYHVVNITDSIDLDIWQAQATIAGSDDDQE